MWTLLLGLEACTGGQRNELPTAPPNVLVLRYDTSLHKTDAGWYYKGKSFSGYMVETEKDHRVVYKLPILAGKENGLAKGWYNTGEKLLVRYFVDGRKEGVFKQWWPNGRLRYLFRFKQDQYHGQQLVYFPSGQKRQASQYVNGDEEGVQRTWDEAGELVSNYTIHNKKVYGVIAIKSCMPVTH